METIWALAIDGYARTVSPETRLPYTLATALAEARGCGGATVCRSESGSGWKVIVRNAGSDTEVVHEPTGRRIYRRLTSWSQTRLRWDLWVRNNDEHNERLYGSTARKKALIAQLAAGEPIEEATFAGVRQLARGDRAGRP